MGCHAIHHAHGRKQPGSAGSRGSKGTGGQTRSDPDERERGPVSIGGEAPQLPSPMHAATRWPATARRPAVQSAPGRAAAHAGPLHSWHHTASARAPPLAMPRPIAVVPPTHQSPPPPPPPPPTGLTTTSPGRLVSPRPGPQLPPSRWPAPQPSPRQAPSSPRLPAAEVAPHASASPAVPVAGI